MIMGSPSIEIDNHSGFCFGVTTSINKAEAELEAEGPLYSLGDLVHNSAEMERLHRRGLTTVTHADMPRLSGARLLLRAHGEPPSTYRKARECGIEIIDATCPVVLKLQQRINHAYHHSAPATQIVIYGKAGHAEVNGLVGQTEGTAIVVDDTTALDAIDFSRPVLLYSQTTMSLEGWSRMVDRIASRMEPGVRFEHYDTICRQVSGRVEHLRRFAAAHDVVLFVSGRQSSNGKVLCGHCREVNPLTYMISDPSEIDASWLTPSTVTIGICGATSTPRWLMEDVARRCGELTAKDR